MSLLDGKLALSLAARELRPGDRLCRRHGRLSAPVQSRRLVDGWVRYRLTNGAGEVVPADRVFVVERP